MDEMQNLEKEFEKMQKEDLEEIKKAAAKDDEDFARSIKALLDASSDPDKMKRLLDNIAARAKRVKLSRHLNDRQRSANIFAYDMLHSMPDANTCSSDTELDRYFVNICDLSVKLSELKTSSGLKVSNFREELLDIMYTLIRDAFDDICKFNARYNELSAQRSMTAAELLEKNMVATSAEAAVGIVELLNNNKFIEKYKLKEYFDKMEPNTFDKNTSYVDQFFNIIKAKIS